MQYTLQALLRRRLLFPALVLGGLLIPLFTLSCASLRGSHKASKPPAADSTSLAVKAAGTMSVPGKLSGRVVDAKTGEGLPGAKITILGTKMDTSTDVDGNYQINGIPPGAYTVQVDFIGFKTTRKKGVKIKPGEIKQLKYELELNDWAFNKNNPELKAYLAEQEKGFREDLRQNPDDAQARYDLANIYEDRGNIQGAIKEVRILIKPKPDDADLHYRLSDLLGKDHQWSESEKEYRTAVRLKGDDAQTHHNFAEWLQNRKKCEEAIVEYRKTIQLGVDDAVIRWRLGDLLSHFGRWDEAEKEYLESERMDNPEGSEEDRINRLLPEIKDREGFVNHYRNTFRLNSKDRIAKWNYLNSLNVYGNDLFRCKTKERYEEAEKVFAEVQKINPKDKNAPFFMACCFAALGEKEKAMKLLQDDVKNGFNDWSSWVTSKELDGIRTDPRFKELEEVVKVRWKKVSPRPIIYVLI